MSNLLIHKQVVCIRTQKHLQKTVYTHQTCYMTLWYKNITISAAGTMSNLEIWLTKKVNSFTSHTIVEDKNKDPGAFTLAKEDLQMTLGYHPLPL